MRRVTRHAINVQKLKYQNESGRREEEEEENIRRGDSRNEFNRFVQLFRIKRLEKSDRIEYRTIHVISITRFFLSQ